MIEGLDASTIASPHNAISYDAFEDLHDHKNTIDAVTHEARNIETELGGMQGVLSNDKNLQSLDNVGRVKDRADGLRDRLDAIEQEVSQTVENKKNFDVRAADADIQLSAKSQTVPPAFGGGSN